MKPKLLNLDLIDFLVIELAPSQPTKYLLLNILIFKVSVSWKTTLTKSFEFIIFFTFAFCIDLNFLYDFKLLRITRSKSG